SEYGYMIVESAPPAGYEGDFSEYFAQVQPGNVNVVTVTIENTLAIPPDGTDVYMNKLVCDTEPTLSQKAAFQETGVLPPTCTLGDPNTNWTFDILSGTGEVITNVSVGPDG